MKILFICDQIASMLARKSNILLQYEHFEKNFYKTRELLFNFLKWIYPQSFILLFVCPCTALIYLELKKLSKKIFRHVYFISSVGGFFLLSRTINWRQKTKLIYFLWFRNNDQTCILIHHVCLNRSEVKWTR